MPFKKLIDDLTANDNNARTMRLQFYCNPFGKTNPESLDPDEMRSLFSMRRDKIKNDSGSTGADAYKMESNWPEVGKYDWDPWSGVPDAKPCVPPAAAGAGAAWGDPEPHIVNIFPSQGSYGQGNTIVTIVGEGILDTAEAWLVDGSGADVARFAPHGSANKADYYHVSNFRRIYLRVKVPQGVAPGLYAVHVRNDPNDKSLDIKYGPSFRVLP